MPTTSASGSSEAEPIAPPLHGFRGNHAAAAIPTHPHGLTVTISREAGARGTMIARKLAELLGWQVFDQELLDYLLLDETGQTRLLADIPASARAWADQHLTRLIEGQRLNADAETTGLFRLILAIAARGDAVIVGRGAGVLLPAASTLNVRVVAPLEARVSYLAQMLRLTRTEAANEVRDRDERRHKYLARTVLIDPGHPTVYDLVVNSDRLGVEGASQFIGWAVRTKQQFAEIQASEESLQASEWMEAT